MSSPLPSLLRPLALRAHVCAVAPRPFAAAVRAVVAVVVGAPRVVRYGGDGGGVDTGGGATDEASDLPHRCRGRTTSRTPLRAWHASLSLQPLRLCLQHALLQVTACYADGRFELRRMADQLLPAVVEVALWAEAAVLEQLWVSFLPLADTLPCWLAAASLQLTLERAHTLGHAAPYAAAQLRRALPAALPLVTAALERATSDRHRLVCARLIGTLFAKGLHAQLHTPAAAAAAAAAATALLECMRASLRAAHPHLTPPPPAAAAGLACPKAVAARAASFGECSLDALRADLPALAAHLPLEQHRATLLEWILAQLKLPADAHRLAPLLDAIPPCLAPPAAASATAPAPPSNGRRLDFGAEATGQPADAADAAAPLPSRASPPPGAGAHEALATLTQLIAPSPPISAAALKLALAACRHALMRLPDASRAADVALLVAALCTCLRSGGASAPASPLVDLSAEIRRLVGVRRASFDGEKQQLAAAAAASKAAAAAADDASASEGDEDEDEDESDWDDWDDDEEEEAAAETQAGAAPRLEEVGRFLLSLCEQPADPLASHVMHAIESLSAADRALLHAAITHVDPGASGGAVEVS